MSVALLASTDLPVPHDFQLIPTVALRQGGSDGDSQRYP
jgi:hypothetical protein